MENRVGDKALTDQKRTAMLKQIHEVTTVLKSIGVVLTPDERKRVLRARRGADEHIETVLRLARKHELNLKNIPLDGLAADLALGKQLDSIETELRVALTIAEDTGAQADSEAWEAFLAYYGILQSMAQRNAEIETELGTVVEFMSNGPRKKNTEK